MTGRTRLFPLLLLLAVLAIPAPALAAAGDPIVLADDALAPAQFLKAVDRVLANGTPQQLTGKEALRLGAGLAFSGPQTVVTAGLNSVSRTDLATGQVSTVAAPTGGDMRGVALGPDGSLFATDFGPTAGQAADGRVLRIDPVTGAATPVSTGGALINPLGIAVAEDGTVFVTNSTGTGQGTVVRVDPATGEQEVLPSNPNPLVAPWGIAFLPDGELVVADESFNHAFRGALVQIDPATGRQAPLLLERLNGPIDGATAVAVDAAGEVLVTERGSGQVDRVDMQTGVAQQIGQGIPSPIGIETEPGVAPTTRLLSGPSGTTRNPTPTFTFEPSQYGSQSVCAIDRGPAVPCRRTFTTGPLANGVHSFFIHSSRFGFAGPQVVRNFAVDPAALDTQIDSGPTDPTNDKTPTFTFEAPGGGTSFTCAIDSQPRVPCASPFTTGDLGDGPHTFNVRADNDQVGDTRTFTVDTTPPQATITSGPGEGIATNVTRPVFTFASSEDPAIFICSLDGFTGLCGSVFQPGASLNEGPHVLTVAAKDAAGNIGTPLIRHFTVDTTPPQTTITAGPDGVTDDATPSFEFSASEPGVSFRCSVDGAAPGGCASPFTVAPALADGTHSFQVRATDAAGNVEVTGAERAFTVDADVPDTSITAGPSGPTNDSTPSFEFESTKPGSSFACSLDGAAAAPCASPFTTGPLVDGAHTFTVTSTDALGHEDLSPATRTFTIDTEAPHTLVGPGPAPLINDSTPQFVFASEPGAAFTCSIDAGPALGCASPFTAPPLADGPHTMRVTATDAAGNVEVSLPQYIFTIDTVAPQTTITAGPDGVTDDATPSFEFSASEPGVSFRCSVDGAALGGCASPFTVAPALSDGAHSFQVRATDAAGNVEVTGAERAFTVDADVPDTSITAGPSGPTNDSTPSFEFESTKPGSSFACSLDGAAATPCASPFTTGPLVDGEHTFTVTATDALGHEDPSPAARAFTVDTAAPDTEITAGPGETTDRRPTFAFRATETATFACSLDAAPAAPCGGSFQPDTPLALGAHILAVTATDAAGNADPTPAARSFRVIEVSSEPHPEPPPPANPPIVIATQLQLHASLKSHSLRIRAQLVPATTGTVAVTIRGRANRRPLSRHLAITLSGGAGTAVLKLPTSVTQVRVVATYAGEGTFAASSTAATVRASQRR